MKKLESLLEPLDGTRGAHELAHSIELRQGPPPALSLLLRDSVWLALIQTKVSQGKFPSATEHRLTASPSSPPRRHGSKAAASESITMPKIKLET